MRPAILPLAAVLLAAVSGPAAAATLGIPTRGAPIASGAGTAFHDPVLGFDLLGDGAASSTSPALATGLLVTVPFADVASTPKGALFVTTGTGQSFLSGDLDEGRLRSEPPGRMTGSSFCSGISMAFRPARSVRSRCCRSSASSEPIRSAQASEASMIRSTWKCRSPLQSPCRRACCCWRAFRASLLSPEAEGDGIANRMPVTRPRTAGVRVPAPERRPMDPRGV